MVMAVQVSAELKRAGDATEETMKLQILVQQIAETEEYKALRSAMMKMLTMAMDAMPTAPRLNLAGLALENLPSAIAFQFL